jgi:Mn2+/Fe2+ NRAMP family transporter
VTVAVALTNLVLGTVYTSYGLMTIVDLKRGWRQHGFSHFGVAWLFMAFTCGPHHLDHGYHVLAAGRAGGALDLATILIGFPAGVVWFLLRVEAMLGGRGDRTVAGTPLWLKVLPTASFMYLAGVATGIVAVVGEGATFQARTWPNIALVVLYAAIGVVLLRTQNRNYEVTERWSMSGLTLSIVMITCAVMHAVYVGYAHDGRYDLDIHGLTIDTIGVPAAAYFLWVTYALYRGWLRDWDRSPAPPTTATTSASA